MDGIFNSKASSAPSLTSTGNGLVLSGTILSTTYPAPRSVAGTTDAITSADAGGEVIYNNAAAVAVSIAAATTTGLTQGFAVFVSNFGKGSVTVTPATSTINGAATLVIPQYTGALIFSDGTNYQIDLTGSSNLVFFYPNGDTTSTKLGSGALVAQTGTSLNHTAVGNKASNRMTGGNQVTAIGDSANELGTTTQYSVAAGFQALRAGASNAVAVGVGALQATTGATNTGVGFHAGQSVSSGQDNTILGASAGATNVTTGNSNIVIGSSQDIVAAGNSLECNIGGAIRGKLSKPQISSGFGASPSVPSGSSSFAFTVNVGTGGTASSGVLAMNMTAPTGWTGYAVNTTNTATLTVECTPTSTTTMTLTSYSRTTGLLTAFGVSDVIAVQAWAY